jgi:ribulose 1,5-bisphosphate synthetase/thiazole synthase
MTDNIKDVVIVGAGPYGLATAAYAKHYFTGLFCTKRFGPIFGFVLGCQVAPIITMKGLARSAQHA